MNLYLAFLVLFVPSVVSQDTCGEAGTINVAGSTTVEPIARAWAEGYQAKCPGTTVNVTGGGSTIGARKVCNLTSAGFPVEIGNMSREWRLGSEVNQTAPFKYVCNQGDKTRTVTQVEVAIDGLSVVLLNGGLVAQCVRNNVTGAGLTIDQLRWIYSNYTRAQLLASKWNASALGNADNDDATHRWSELNAACPAVEIKLASPGLLSGTFTFFKETVLPNATEGIATNRLGAPLFTSDDDEELVQFVATSSNEAYGDAITYFGYAFYAVKGPLFYGVPIQPIAGGAYIKPTQQNVEDGLYTPLSRRIYMNFLDSTLPLTAAFLSYGFNPEGIKRLEKTGYGKPTRAEIVDGLKRVGRDAPIPTAAPVRPPTVPPVVPTAAPVRPPTVPPVVAPIEPPTFPPFVVPLVPVSVSPQETCGPAGTIYIAGSTTVAPLALAWAEDYKAECPNTNISVTGGGSTIGVQKVCNVRSAGFPVEIGMTSRELFVPSEVSKGAEDYKYICNQGDTTRTITQVEVATEDTTRTITQVEVATDGLTIVLVNGGAVAKAIQENGLRIAETNKGINQKGLKISETNKGIRENGLKIAQLRWIFSNWTMAQLIADGWNSSALANSDGNDTTHLWSEINAAFPTVEIKLASLGLLSGTYSFFKDTVLPGKFEGIATNRPGAPLFIGEDEEALIQYLNTSSNELYGYGDAITYFGYVYYKKSGPLLYGVPIQPLSGGAFIEPTQQNVEAGLYTPLSRPIYFNFLDSALPLTAPLLCSGFRRKGISRLEAIGYIKPTRTTILAGLKQAGLTPVTPTPCGLFGLSIFCPFTLCGVLGRLLGLCNSKLPSNVNQCSL
jgi:ABC-type phosphate transport system substrate-binding protein